MVKKYVQYGCGLTAPKEWLNYDVSPTLRLQRIPILGRILKMKLKVIFPDNVRYGDIIRGLPKESHNCDGLYCSHTLEHLCLDDFRKALKNSYLLLKEGGIFRCVVPDLEYHAREYLINLDKGEKQANITFFNSILMGVTKRPRNFKSFISSFYGNSHHLWMWDKKSLIEELRKVGFTKIRVCSFNDSKDDMFVYVEEQGRFENAVAIECIK